MTTEHFDVLVVGAGISGIGAGCHLLDHCPDRSFVMLEGRGDLGGTWDLFQYPGIRSDSDMHTLGYGFRPWTGNQAIADGPSILAYLRDTAREYDLEKHMRFQRKVRRAEWSSDEARWAVEVDDGSTGESEQYTCGYLFMCAGYYSYRGGYSPDFPGSERFAGPIVHPQQWPDDLDYTGKKVVVIGSGATAVTLVPAMAGDAEHVTMLQRSPTYIASAPDVDPIANALRKVLPDRIAHPIIRTKNVLFQHWIYRQTRTNPEKVKKKLLDLIQKELGPDYDVEKHFTPNYDPWDQRLCLVPNSDLFTALKSGSASVVTDTIETFTEQGIELTSGETIEADIIVTATGLNIVTLGEVDFAVDGEPVDFSQTFTYKGFAFSDVPNLGTSFGYVNASWTLRSDLVCRYVCRLLEHMRETDTEVCTPRLRPSDEGMATKPWLDRFQPGFIARVLPTLPKQGDREPWLNPQNYLLDRKRFLRSEVDDGVMQFSAQPVDAHEIPVGASTS